MLENVRDFLTNHRKCNHKWHLIVNKEIQSPYEQLISQGETFDTIMGLHWGIELFKKTAVILMICEKCGSVDKSIVASVQRTIE